jgi:hypothetical protein
MSDNIRGKTSNEWEESIHGIPESHIQAEVLVCLPEPCAARSSVNSTAQIGEWQLHEVSQNVWVMVNVACTISDKIPVRWVRNREILLNLNLNLNEMFVKGMVEI